MLGFFDLRFARPMYQYVVNGVTHSCRISKLFDDSYLTEFLDENGEVEHVWVERLDHRGLRIAQYSPRELSIQRYKENTANVLTAMEAHVIWQQPFKSTSTWEVAGKAQQENLYEFDRFEVFVTAIRDENGRVICGTIKSVWHTTVGQRFEKTQNLIVFFPDPNAMEVVFEGYGEPWSHCNKRLLYRLDGNGNLIVERDLTRL